MNVTVAKVSVSYVSLSLFLSGLSFVYYTRSYLEQREGGRRSSRGDAHMRTYGDHNFTQACLLLRLVRFGKKYFPHINKKVVTNNDVVRSIYVYLDRGRRG